MGNIFSYSSLLTKEPVIRELTSNIRQKKNITFTNMFDNLQLLSFTSLTSIMEELSKYREPGEA